MLGILTSVLQVHLYNNGKQAWTDIIKQWREDPHAVLVVASPFAQEECIRKYGEYQGRGIITLPNLWQQARALSVRGGLIDEDVAALLLPLIEEDSLLAPFARTPESLFPVLQALKSIEENADQTFEDNISTDIERELQRLRNLLEENNIFSHARTRTIIARNAKNAVLTDIKPDQHILVAPFGLAAVSIGGLFKGLSRDNRYRISTWVLTTPQQETLITKAAGFYQDKDLSAANIHRHYDDNLPSYSFPVNTKAKAEIWRVCKDAREMHSVVEAAAKWGEEGVFSNDIVVVTPPGYDQDALVRLAGERGLPVCITRSITTLDCRIGSLLLAALDMPYSAFSTIHPDCMTEQQHTELRQGDTRQQLLACYNFANRYVIEHFEDEQALDILWLAALLRSIEHGHIVVGAYHTLQNLRSNKYTVGDSNGVAIMTYAQAAGLPRSHVILCGLDAGRYPLAQSSSYLFSASLVAKLPALRSAPSVAEYIPMLCASNRLFALCISSPSSLWQQLRQCVEFESAPLSLHTRKQTLITSARNTIRPRELEEYTRRYNRMGGLDFEGLQHRMSMKTSFTVTEIEKYVGCQRGWFVSSVLHAKGRPGIKLTSGVFSHNVLQQMVEEKRAIDQLMDVMKAQQQDAKYPVFTPQQTAVFYQQISKVLLLSSGEQWPYTSSLCEYAFESSTLIPGITLKGKADRIDTHKNHALVIDYKRSKSKAQSGAAFQAFAYPLMYKEKYPDAIIDGATYISLRHGHCVDILSGESLWNPSDKIRWTEAKREKALDAMKAAVDDIRACVWLETMTCCDMPWCEHHLLSQTTEAR